MSANLHSFIIWNKGMHKKDEILQDIKRRFEVLGLYDIIWSDKNFSRNMSRFYGRNMPRNSRKEEETGRGPFKLVVVRVGKSIYAERKTTKGIQMVDAQMFDAKMVYRKWAGGNKVHGTNLIEETKRDLTLLLSNDCEKYFKQNPPPWNGEEIKLNRDIQGSDGWRDLRQVFNALNLMVNYVVLRNFECLPDAYYMGKHKDIDLLTDNIDEMVYVTNARKIHNKRYRVNYGIKIKDKEVFFDFRHVGDKYYDDNSQKRLLKNRVFSKGGFFIPDKQGYFYTFLYHALVHKKSISDDYIVQLTDMARGLGFDKFTAEFLQNRVKIKKFLDDYLAANGYDYTEPKDLSVYFNQDFARGARISFARKKNIHMARIRRAIKNIARRLLLFKRRLPVDKPKNLDIGCSIETNRAILTRIDQHTILKEYKEENLWAKDVEVRCLRRLEPFPHFPKLFDVGKTWIKMEWVGDHLTKISELGQLNEIVKILSNTGIVHRDICPHNLLYRDGQLFLVDFGWAIIDGEETPLIPPKRLGRGFYAFGKWDDARAAKKVYACCSKEMKVSST